MLFGSNGNNNICLAGNQTVGADQYNVNGYNPTQLRNCSCWCVFCNTVNNTNIERYVRQINNPRIFAGLQITSNYNMGYIRNCDRIHGVNLISESFSFGCVRTIHPITTSYVSNVYMYQNLPLSNYTPCVTIQATAAYGYTFSNWRANSISGNFITNSNPTSLYTTGTYGSTAYRSLRNVYANFSTSSDKRLKKNIKLIGVSKQGYNIYSFEYKNPEKFGYGTYQGVIAQEIPEHSTWNSEGYLMIDYSKIDVKYKKLYGSNLDFGKRNKIRRFLQSIKNFITNSIGFSMEKIPSGS